RNVLAGGRGFHAEQYQILPGGGSGQSRRIGPLQNVSTARRQKDIEATELSVALLRSALFDRQRGFGQQVARFRQRIARTDDLPTPVQTPGTGVLDVGADWRGLPSPLDEEHQPFLTPRPCPP